MTQEQIEKLAEEKHPAEIKEKMLGIVKVKYQSAVKIAFINGYTTCQQTEVAELKKELERVKRLMEHIYKQHAALPATRDLKWDNFKQQNNL